MQVAGFMNQHYDNYAGSKFNLGSWTTRKQFMLHNAGLCSQLSVINGRQSMVLKELSRNWVELNRRNWIGAIEKTQQATNGKWIGWSGARYIFDKDAWWSPDSTQGSEQTQGTFHRFHIGRHQLGCYPWFRWFTVARTCPSLAGETQPTTFITRFLLHSVSKVCNVWG